MAKKKEELAIFSSSPWSITIIKGKKELFRSNMGGIWPLMQAINQLTDDLIGADLYDKVIGRAASFLIVYARFRRVYTPVISKSALDILRRARIPVTYLKRVDRILDREQRDLCPMEKISLDADTPEDFIRLVKRHHVISI